MTFSLSVYWSIWGALFASFFDVALKLGCHEWLALRCLITNSRNSVFTGGFLKSFLKVGGRTKNRSMKRLLHGALRLRNSPTGKQIKKWPTDGWNYKRHDYHLMWLSIVLSFGSPCRAFCSEHFVILLNEIQPLFPYFLYGISYYSTALRSS